MNIEVWEEIQELTQEYNNNYKVDSGEIPAGNLWTPEGKAGAVYTQGGWIQASKHDRYGYIIKKGSLFPKDKFQELKDELYHEWGICLIEGDYGINWTPWHVTTVEENEEEV